MNRLVKNKYLYSKLIITCIIPIILIGCKNKDEEVIEQLEMNKGSIVLDENGDYEVYNYNERNYEKINSDYIITAYNSESKNFIYNEKGEYKVNYKGKDTTIEESRILHNPKLSLDGKYISYFIKEDYLDLKVKDIETLEYIDINSNVAISGDLIDWITNDILVYYGIDNNKVNGIFTYNIKNSEEKLLYKLDKGYIEYIEVIENGIVFVQEKGIKDKYLKILNVDGTVEEEIEGISEVRDVEKNSEGIFILGKLEDNNYSLYKYSDGKIKRLIYDFPKLVNLEKGLSKDSNGAILFMGSDENYNTPSIYSCSDDTISLINSKEGNYYFIDFN